jgi:hypothetical protein
VAACSTAGQSQALEADQAFLSRGITMTAESAASRRLTQGLNYALHGGVVGVVNVYEKDGSVVAQLSIFDPVSTTEHIVLVKPNDEFLVGTERYRVVAVARQSVDQRAWLDIVRIGPQRCRIKA